MCKPQWSPKNSQSYRDCLCVQLLTKLHLTTYTTEKEEKEF